MAALAATMAVPAYAGFVNGGFETGDFTGWTKNGGTFVDYGSGGVYTYSGDPGKSAIVSSGLDPLTNNNLNRVYSGNYAARVNNSDNNYHFSTISQTGTNWQDNNIYFAWAAVLEEPGNTHPENVAPNFSIKLHDDITGVDIYSMEFNVYNAASTGITWNNGYDDGYNTWKYNNWEVVALDTSGVKGDTLSLTLLAAGCAWGGHGGYAYLDGFGAAPPTPGTVPEPTTLALLGLGMAGLGFTRRRKA